MPSSSNSELEDTVRLDASDADLAQAFKDLARGEKTANALESNLTNLEKKLDDLLASFEESERLKIEAMSCQSGGKNEGGGKIDKR